MAPVIKGETSTVTQIFCSSSSNHPWHYIRKVAKNETKKPFFNRVYFNISLRYEVQAFISPSQEMNYLIM